MTAVFNEQKFLQLPESTQHLLEFMSIIYAPIAATPLSKLAPVAVDVKVLRPVLNDLVALGFLSVNGVNYYACVDGIRDELTRRSLRAGRFAALAVIVVDKLSPEAPRNAYWNEFWADGDHALRDLRLQALLGNSQQLATVLGRANRQYAATPKFRSHPWRTLWGGELDTAWIPCFSADIYLQFIAPVYLSLADKNNQDVSNIWEHCQQLLQAEHMDTAALWTVFGSLYYDQLFLRGQWSHPLAAQPPQVSEAVRLEQWHVFAAALAFSQGKRDEAILSYQMGLKLLRKRQSSRKIRFGSKQEILCILALVLEGSDKSLKDAAACIKELSPQQPAYKMLGYFADSRMTGKIPTMPDELEAYQDEPLNRLFSIIVRYWLGHDIPATWWNPITTYYQQLDAAGYTWLTDEYAAVLAHLLPDKDKRKPLYVGLSAAAHAKAGTQPLITRYKPQPVWEHTLLALQRLGKAATPTAGQTPKTGTERVVWALNKVPYGHSDAIYNITPRLQKSTKAGWSGGRNIALKKLAEEVESFPFLTPEDQRVCQAIRHTYDYYHNGYELEIENAWPYLIGHPRVFWETAPNTPLDIQQGREELLILKEKGKLRIKLFPELSAAQNYKPDSYFMVEETTLQLKLYKLTANVLQLHGILGKDGLLVPAEAEATVRQTLAALAPMITIQSDIAGMDNAEISATLARSSRPVAGAVTL